MKEQLQAQIAEVNSNQMMASIQTLDFSEALSADDDEETEDQQLLRRTRLALAAISEAIILHSLEVLEDPTITEHQRRKAWQESDEVLQHWHTPKRQQDRAAEGLDEIPLETSNIYPRRRGMKIEVSERLADSMLSARPGASLPG